MILDGKVVDQITSYIDDTEVAGNPYSLLQNAEKSFIGSYVLGKGFVLEPREAIKLIEKNPKNKEVLFPYLNGADLNTSPDQSPSRWVINFFDWPEEKCRNEYPDCFEILERLVKPERQRKNEKGQYSLRKPLPQKWWIYADKRPKLYRKIGPLERVIVVAQVSKTVAFEFVNNDKVFDAKLIVFSLNRYQYFSFLQSSLHYNWAWKYCTTMKADLTYTPNAIFQTFPFPQNLSSKIESSLEQEGEKYHSHRQKFMLKVQIGLTKTYNLFHQKDLSIEDIIKASKQPQEICESAYEDIIKLRELQKQMDGAVLQAYGWLDIDLAHDFYEVDYLPENDRIRYTISPDARKEILKRLLKLNHEIHEQELMEGKSKKGKSKKKTKPDDSNQLELF